ncbi:TolC family protein, partial [Marinobacter lipolyticus]|uniref:TolC family protein n=1 Tax=Marinobacter lipolyticus TaxID=209639 RepID=UPI003A8E2CFD
SQSIPWPGKRQLRVEKMAADTDALLNTYAQSRDARVAEVREVWAQWWYVHFALEINASLRELIADQSAVTQTRYANGLGEQQDLLKIQTFDLKLQHQHLELEQQRVQLQSHLNYLLGQPSTTAMPRPQVELEGPQLAPRAQLDRWLLEAQPALLGLQANIQSALIQKRLTEKEDYPDVQFSLGYNELWNEPAQRLQLGLSFNIPLDFGKRTARKSAADYTLHSVRMEAESKRDELLSQLESYMSNYEQAAHKIRLIENELLPSATRLLEANLASYEGGGGDFNELVDARQELLDTQLLLRSTYAERFIVLAQIDKLTGGRLWQSGESQ